MSSGAASATAWNGYLRMKGELENAVRELNVQRTVIIRPGLMVGTRKDSRPSEAVMRNLAKLAGAVSGGLLKDFWAQDAEVIARAAVTAGLQALKREDKVWVVNQAEVVRLGRTDWMPSRTLMICSNRQGRVELSCKINMALLLWCDASIVLMTAAIHQRFKVNRFC